jgi:hypothetical protein
MVRGSVIRHAAVPQVASVVFIAPPDSLRKGFSYQTPDGRTLARGHNRIPENCSRVRNIDDKWNL